MKRFLNILLISVSLITMLHIFDGSDEAGRNDNIVQLKPYSTLEILDIPLENQSRRVISKDLSNPQSIAKTNYYGAMTTSVAIYTLHKRVHNISSHSTNSDIKIGSHKFISYGILRV